MPNQQYINEIEAIAQRVLEISLQIHRDFGPGLLESIYQEMLVKILEKDGYKVQTEVPLAYEYQGIKFQNNLRIDMLVDNKLIVELKATERFNPVHARQLNTYLIISKLPLGLLINFGGETIKDNCKRVLNIRHPLAKAIADAADKKLENKRALAAENLTPRTPRH